jgi:deoxyribonuclease I
MLRAYRLVYYHSQHAPPQLWEWEQARRIEAIQGNRNPFIWNEVQPAMTTSADMAPSPSGSIIGNRSSKMYHRPGCPNYAKIAPENRVAFASEEEALAAGYRVAGNCW